MEQRLIEMINGIKDFVPEKIGEDEPFEANRWNTLVDYLKRNNEILEKMETVVPPVGFIYIRLPGAKTPYELWDMKPEQWDNISRHFPNVFFRVEDSGNDKNTTRPYASVFKESVSLDSETPQTDLTYNEGDGGTGGGQMDAIRDITGNFFAQGTENAEDGGGAFKTESTGRNDKGYSSGRQYPYERSFMASRVVPVANENRPKNITVQIWMRIS
ncbi:hypothetical protein [Breznakiella homolactica]|uniref:Tail fiber protein n=1 Tax=Breznakiella homolactica TaxID=2798577 RepID=A0A7T8BB20_9SPIR|nr:hypothetical protein [Breznakiella homolactica]QQO10097.1 hypothetical protein JFL75_04040 [Breznakiella homolactica]